MSGGDKAQKLVDLSNFSIYFDTELLGDLEGQALVVSNHIRKHESLTGLSSATNPQPRGNFQPIIMCTNYMYTPTCQDAKF